MQSSYIPWKGWFDLAASVDELILLDDVQYTRRDWRNRNRIKTAHGPRWLTIPVHSKGRYLQRIDEVEVSEADWRARHWRALQASYAHAPCFGFAARALEATYLGSEEPRLSEINRELIDAVCALLGIDTTISRSRDYEAPGRSTERLVRLCQAAGADEYLSGPTARAYLDERAFESAGIALRWMDYSDYPDYPQLHPPFEHKVSVLDLLFNVGARAPAYMLHARARAGAVHA